MTKVHTTNYPVGDFLIQLKNASMAKNKEVKVRQSKKILAVANALKKIGFLEDVKNEKDGILVVLTFKNKKPLLLDIKLISKPGLRIYMGVDELASKKGPCLYLVSTPSGVISSLEAVKKRTGGEVIAKIM